MIKCTVKGDFSKSKHFFTAMQQRKMYNVLDKYGREGVQRLMQATPLDTGKTAASWSYAIDIQDRYATIVWSNDNVTDQGIPIVLFLQYGHATKGDTYVPGQDFINPTMEPLFKKIKEAVWREVVNS